MNRKFIKKSKNLNDLQLQKQSDPKIPELKSFKNSKVVVRILLSVFIGLFVCAICLFIFWWPYSFTKKTTKIVISTPKSLKPIKILALGDISCDPTDKKFDGNDPEQCQDKKVNALVKSVNPEKILLLGDLAYNSGTTYSFIHGFNQTWGDLKSKFLPTPGNHEYGTKNAQGYFEYFGSQAGETLKGYYAAKIGDWAIYSLNSNCPETNDCSQNSSQLSWLSSQLHSSSSMCKLAFWHHPQFSTSKHSLDPTQTNRMPVAWELLQKAKVDIILNGHEHNYERFAPQLLDGTASGDGVREFVVGTGGRSLYQKIREDKNSEFFYSGFGALELELYPKSYSWKFYNVNAQILDSGSQSCK